MLHFSFERRLLLAVSALLVASGIAAVALTPALSDQVRPVLQSFGLISCSSSGPCQEGKNASTGAGLEGISTKGSGVIGQTTSSGSHAGVLGQDKSTSPNEAGVKGTSTNGAGLVGLSTNGPGMMSSSSTFDGIESRTFHNSTTTLSGASGVFGGDGSSDGGHLNAGVTGSSFNGIGVEGTSDNWVGVEGTSSNGVGVNVIGGFTEGTGDEFPALSIRANGTGDDIIDGCPSKGQTPCDGFSAFFRVDNLGDVFSPGEAEFHNGILSGGDVNIDGALGIGAVAPSAGSVNISGQYQKSGTCLQGCAVATRSSSGRAVQTYASMVSQPTVEDFGEAQLSTGRTYVRLDPKFANVIDQRTNYLVFITPEGDANTLYVTQKTVGGFTVRESHNGQSSIPFSYRIVAKPFGSHEDRLPMVMLPRLHQRSRPTQAGR